MKKITLTLALLLSTLMSFSQTKDGYGHSLVSLWKSYYKAEQADKPKDQASILEQIKAEALEKHLAWDFYDAAERYVQVRSSINWKDRTKLQSEFSKEIDTFAEPVVVFFARHGSWGQTKSEEYVRQHKLELEKTFNPEFHTRDGYIKRPVYSPVLLDGLITNDYEYALWSLFLAHRSTDIRPYYGTSYPAAAFLEYSDAVNYSDAVAYNNLEQFVKKYDGKAASLLGRQRRLNYEFYLARNRKPMVQKDFIDLREACTTFEKDRAAFKGDEKKTADCCTGVLDLIESLDSKDIDAGIRDGKVTVSLRNIKSLTASIKDDNKTIWDTRLANKAQSYYVRDTVTFDIPAIDDGDYRIILRGEEQLCELSYRKHTLSMAVRAISTGYGAFVAEYDTGRPVKACDLTLMDADGKDIVTAKNVAIDGFTQLPESISQYLNKDKYTNYLLKASLKDGSLTRKSGNMSVRSPHPGIVTKETDYPTRRAVILTDRGAYNPGEVMHYKAIFYTGTYALNLAPEGKDVKVELFDSESNLLATDNLKTGELGSVEGSFELTGAQRGGMFNIKVSLEGKDVENHRVRVDEFVLPTFELTWTPDDHMYLRGEPIHVSGKVTAYSGHALGEVRAYYEVQGEEKKDLEIKPDGTFAFDIIPGNDSPRYGFPVTVTVADNTGETLSFNTYRHANYSIPLNLRLLNTVPGNYKMTPGARSGSRYSSWIIRDDFARFCFNTAGQSRDNLKITYEVKDENGKTIAKGTPSANETLDVDLGGLPSGIYQICVDARAKRLDGYEENTTENEWFVKAADDDKALDMDVLCFFKELGDEEIALQVGSTDGPVWAVAELIGSGNVLLEKRMLTLKGERGKTGSLETISYSRKDSYPENLTLNVLFFHKGECHKYSRTLRLPVLSTKMPLSFTRFVDTAKPGEKYSLILQTDPEVECAAAIYDKATEKIQPNEWYSVSPARRREPEVYYRDLCGFNGEYFDDRVLYSKAAGGRVLARNAAAVESAMVLEDSFEARLDEESSDMGAAKPEEEVRVRDNFAATMAWEPMLRSSGDGTVEFEFTGADRLSTYYVQVFAHGKGMKNAVLREEMVVTIPVKVALMQPLYLYEGDTYIARSTLSSGVDKPVGGQVSVRFFDGEDYKTSKVLATKTARVTIPAGGSIPFEAEYNVPEGLETLGVLVKFVADDSEYGSDAMFVTIPAKKAIQTLTEAHSAVLLAGADREGLIASLRSEFVNADASTLVPVERDILAMIREAIPDSVEPRSSNVLSLTEAYYSNVIARRVGAAGLSDEEMKGLMEKIGACQNAGGGIAWFEGMSASPIVTAAVLQRIAAMPEQDTAAIDVKAAIGYLDSTYFSDAGRPWWCGCLSLPVYLQTRALYPSVPFKSPGGKAFREFKKEVRLYLVPASTRGMNGRILDKARRLRTLQSLAQHPDGKKLAKSWGICSFGKVTRSLDADVESLLQYSVDHRSGGIYYPNAVMPWRGLLESELYAHSLLCNLFTNAAAWGRNASGKPLSYAEEARRTAEGIRLWIMIQKETQNWRDDAAYIEAIACVLGGTPETLATKVILLSTTFTKPFTEVKAAGNGFTVERQFTLNGKLLSEGDKVKVGDRILAKYNIWSEENRSFVRLTSPRPASLRPVSQLSGHYGWWLSPMSWGGWHFSPQGYRNVLSDKTEYWFDSYPEEHTTITEEFFVTQEGAFQMPAVEIESLYAPHYRANDSGRSALVSE